MNRSNKYWNKVAEKYEKSPISDEVAYQKTLSEMQSYFSTDMKILELGCGTGTTAINNAPFVKHIDAIDISENMIDIGRNKANKAGVDNISFSCSALMEFNADTHHFDAVLGMHVLHLLPDRQAVLEEIARIVKPGGVFISNTACLANSYFRFAKFILPLAKLLGFMPDVYFISEAELAEEISNAGFTIEKQQHQGMQNIEVFMIARKI